MGRPWVAHVPSLELFRIRVRVKIQWRPKDDPWMTHERPTNDPWATPWAIIRSALYIMDIPLLSYG